MSDLVDREPFDPEYQSDAAIAKHNRTPADTPDPRPVYDPTKVCARYFGSDGTLCSTHGGRFASDVLARCDRWDRPVSPPSTLTADALAVLDYITGSTGGANRPMPSQVAATLAARRLLDVARAAPQAGVRLRADGWWEQDADVAEWREETGLYRDAHGAPQADTGTLREAAIDFDEMYPPLTSPATAGREAHEHGPLSWVEENGEAWWKCDVCGAFPVPIK